jgi:plasmid replication initiation protein
MRWVFHVKYREGQGCVELGFSPTVLPHLTMLNKEFTSYQLKQIGSLSSFYAVRLYELMSQFLKLGERSCTLDQLRQMLDLGDKYQDVKDMRKRVLDPALKEMNANTDLAVTAEPMRKGRKITGFSFTISKNDQMALQL